MKRRRLPLLVALFALWPTVASAQIGYIWEWIEQMSGPGPWNAHSGEVRLFCVTPDPAAPARMLRPPRCWNDDARPEIKGHFSIRAGIAYTNGIGGHNNAPLFSDDLTDTRTVWSFKLEPLLMARLSPVIDAGGGIGFMTFSGDGFGTFARLVTTPVSVLITPGAVTHPASKRVRLIKIRYEMYYFPKGFHGRDFNNLTTRYATRSEWTHSVGLVIDYSR